MKLLYQVIKVTIENCEVKEQEILHEFKEYLECYDQIKFLIEKRYLDNNEYYKIEMIYKKLENER